MKLKQGAKCLYLHTMQFTLRFGCFAASNQRRLQSTSDRYPFLPCNTAKSVDGKNGCGFRTAKGRASLISCLEQGVSQELITTHGENDQRNKENATAGKNVITKIAEERLLRLDRGGMRREFKKKKKKEKGRRRRRRRRRRKKEEARGKKKTTYRMQDRVRH